jgi:hypothetical protein
VTGVRCSGIALRMPEFLGVTAESCGRQSLGQIARAPAGRAIRGQAPNFSDVRIEGCCFSG